MNEVTLQGYLRDIEFSHSVGNVDYEKANLICPGTYGREDDIISIIYKKFVNKYNEGDFISLSGNLRSYSLKNEKHNSVQIYVFTYFDMPDSIATNDIKLDGHICKIDKIRYSKYGKQYIHFIVANNIFTATSKLNNYISCTAYGQEALKIAEMDISDYINISGELHSHTYSKKTENEELEYKIAHEVVVKEFDQGDN